MSELTRLKQRLDNLKLIGQPIPTYLWLRYENKRRKEVAALAKPKKKKRKHQPRTSTASKPFYRTAEWKQLRYMTLVQRGGRCECCGASAKDGAKLNVDHVEPISRAWERRLDPTNLQILCGSCNQGKGGRYDDWRD